MERNIGQLTMENRMLLKARNLATKEKEKRFIYCNLLKDLGTIVRKCILLRISRSTYYYKPKRYKSSDANLADRINAEVS